MDAAFARDVRKFAQKALATLDETVRAIKISVFTGVIMDTRVATGRLRGNWQTSTGSPIASETSREDNVAQGSAGGGAYDDAVAGPTADDVDYLTNNLPYAEVWEERDGMVAKNIARVERAVREVVRSG